MSEYEVVEIPMVRLDDGRDAITCRDYVEFDWVRDFVGKFSNYWSYDHITECYVSPTHNPEKEE